MLLGKQLKINQPVNHVIIVCNNNIISCNIKINGSSLCNNESNEYCYCNSNNRLLCNSFPTVMHVNLHAANLNPPNVG